MTAPANKRYIARYRPYRKRLVAGMALSILQALVLVPLPLLVAFAIDDAIPQDRLGLLGVLVGIMAALAALGVVVEVGAQAVTLGVTKRVIKKLRGDLMGRMFSYPKRTHDKLQVTNLHDKIVNDTERVDFMASAVLSDMLPSAILVVGITLILLWLQWILAATVVVFIPLLVFAGRLVLRWLRGWAVKFHDAFYGFSDTALTVLRSQEMARIHGAEDQEMAKVEADTEYLRLTNTKIAIGNTLHRSLQQGLVALAGTAVLMVGGYAVSRGRMTLGELLAFYAGFAILKSPASTMGTAFGKIVEGRKALGRLDDLLEDPAQRPYNGTDQIELVGRLELDQVAMSYGDANVVSGLSFSTEPGRITALAGPNGSGKSTVVSLVLGLYKPTKGTVRADGIPYENLDMPAFRRQLGVVPQEPFIFPGTIRDNISYGHTDVTDDDIFEALKLASAAAIVRRLPNGLDTEVGDDGELLSGGQRQRIAIARALLGHPKVLIFDEPTNHLDAEAVSQLLRSLANTWTDLAVLLISHDSRIMDDCDTVVRLQEGFSATVGMN